MPTASVQLIVFGERNETDLPGVLRDVADAGFPAFEGGNLFASLGEPETRRVLEETGLQVSGAHFGYGDYADPERLAAHITYAQAVGLQNLMCSGVADGRSVEGYRQSAQVFNEAGRRLRDAGLTLNYHNHDWEFKPLDGGTTGMDILRQETDPALVKFNLDVFWLWYAGLDPAEFIRENRDRTGYFHFKDGQRSPNADGTTQPLFTPLGEGEVDLQNVYQAVKEVGAAWIVSEQDQAQGDPKQAILTSRTYLRDAFGV